MKEKKLKNINYFYRFCFLFAFLTFGFCGWMTAAYASTDSEEKGGLLSIFNSLKDGVGKTSNGRELKISEKNIKKLAFVISSIRKNYVSDVSEDTLVNGAISGMLAGLDPHSEYLKKNDLETLEILTAGQFCGVGIEIVPDQSFLKVVSPIDDTPAAKAGIKSGDLIVQIDEKFVKDMSINDAVKMMRGKKGTQVTLTIARKNYWKPLVFKLRRDYVKVSTVKEKLFGQNLGYVRVAFFQINTGEEVAVAIEKLRQKSKNKLAGLILDLRNNPGGLLDSAASVVNDFLDKRLLNKNDMIVYTKGRSKDSYVVARVAPGGGMLSDIPMVVLINEGSASAAEVVAGALQDHKRAVIVGKRSFGKGSVQNLLQVDADSALKLTTALYYTPLGKSIQAKGINPDIEVSDMIIPEKSLTDINADRDNIHFNEASLTSHLKNGGSDGEKAPATNSRDGKTNGHDSNDEVKYNEDRDNIDSKSDDMQLMAKDYQLYEAINVLKTLTVWGTVKGRK